MTQDLGFFAPPDLPQDKLPADKDLEMESVEPEIPHTDQIETDDLLAPIIDDTEPIISFVPEFKNKFSLAIVEDIWNNLTLSNYPIKKAVILEYNSYFDVHTTNSVPLAKLFCLTRFSHPFTCTHVQ
jgi:hypothetical protein